jgi:photosystem II stability/assembly factor-like uncharacterized protein
MRAAFPFLLISGLFLSSCRKDLIAFQHVQQLDSHTTTDRFNRIFFVNDSIGFIVGGIQQSKATILTTHDAGYTWSYKNYPDAGTGIYGISQSPAGLLYTIGYAGKMLYSEDTGATWNFVQLYNWAMNDIAFANADNGIAIGGLNFSDGYEIFIGGDGHYQRQYYYKYELNRVKMANQQTGFMCGYGIVQKSTDGAQTWTALAPNTDNFMSLDIHNNGSEVWMCGYNGSVVHTADGGNSWQTLRNGNDITLVRYRLLDIVFKDEQHGWAVGEAGKVIYSDDGGHHWMEYDHFTDNTLRTIVFCSNGDLLVAGDNGSLYRLQAYP